MVSILPFQLSSIVSILNNFGLTLSSILISNKLSTRLLDKSVNDQLLNENVEITHVSLSEDVSVISKLITLLLTDQLFLIIQFIVKSLSEKPYIFSEKLISTLSTL